MKDCHSNLFLLFFFILNFSSFFLSDCVSSTWIDLKIHLIFSFRLKKDEQIDFLWNVSQLLFEEICRFHFKFSFKLYFCMETKKTIIENPFIIYERIS